MDISQISVKYTENTGNFKLHNVAQMQTGQNIQTIRNMRKIQKVQSQLS